MQPVGNCTANIKNHWLLCTSTTIVSLALIILSMQNLNMGQFKGLWATGSIVLLATGSLTMILSIALICCKKAEIAKGGFNKQSEREKLISSEKATEEAPFEEVYGAKTSLVKDERGFYALTTQEAWKVSAILVENQVLFYKIGSDLWVNFIQESIEKTTRYHQTIEKELKAVDDGLKFMVSEELMLKAINANSVLRPKLNADDSVPKDLTFQISLLRSDEYVEMETLNGMTKYVTFDNGNNKVVFKDVPGGMAHRSFEALELRRQNFRQSKKSVSTS